MTVRALMTAALAILPWLAGASGASGERLIVSLSTHRVQISSNFTGVELTLFGAIEQDAASVGRAGGHAVVITVIGPRQTTVTWRKERILGLWINASSRTFINPPSYLAVLANRPFDTIAPETRQRLRLGLGDFPLEQRIAGNVGIAPPDDPYRRAFVQLKTEQHLYQESANAVTFVTPALFRTGIPLPANVAVGIYEVDAKLFVDGVLIASQSTAFEIVKSGFEQFIAQSAREHGLLYGIATTVLALFTGWLGSIVFRRD